MRVITGFLPPTDGKVRVAGYDVAEHPLEAKRRTGYLPETPPVYPDMTVAEYLTFVARIKGVAGRDVKPVWKRSLSAAPCTTCATARSGNSPKGIGSG